MSKCLNCGGEVRFDIKSQMLICSSCGSMDDPKEQRESADYAQDAESEFTLFVCPQCGGRVYSTDNSINGFCSYCGSNVILRSRIEKMKTPRSLAPFMITKEACKARYLNFVKKALFVPDEIKKEEYLDNFRGIYMPYWGYDARISGFLSLYGTKTIREGGSVYGQSYKCRGWLDAQYQGIFYDASTAFDDHFSFQIAPFDSHALVDFNPAYLSGFYADMGDVGYRVYEDNALRIAENKVFESVQLHKAFPYTTFSDDQLELFRPAMDVEINGIYMSLFPVWFLSHKTDDRVSYAVVNGQTGRVAADLPVDRKKFVITSLLVAIPLFILLSFTILMTMDALLITSEVFAALAVALLCHMVNKITVRDLRLDDRGYLSRFNRLGYLERSRIEATEEVRKRQMGILIKVGTFFLLSILFALSAIQPFIVKDNRMIKLFLQGLLSLALEIMVIKCTQLIYTGGRKNSGWMIAGIWTVFIASLIGFITMCIVPEFQMASYISIILMMTGTLISQLAALGQYNIMTSMPLPQLDRKGGEE